MLSKLIEIIMPRLTKLWDMANEPDKLISVSADEAWDNGILLTFARYDGYRHVMDDTYQMRAIAGKDRIIYEDAVNGADFRDYLEDHDISEESYDQLMTYDGLLNN